jgi:hypothetical protein
MWRSYVRYESVLTAVIAGLSISITASPELCEPNDMFFLVIVAEWPFGLGSD